MQISDTENFPSVQSSHSRILPAIAQLVEHLTVECCSNQMVPGSIPGGRILSRKNSLKVILLDQKYEISDMTLKTLIEQHLRKDNITGLFLSEIPDKPKMFLEYDLGHTFDFFTTRFTDFK